MSWSLLLPLSLGFATVFQSGLNRSLGRAMGLTGAVMLTALVFLVASAALWAAARAWPERLPELLRFPPGGVNWGVWWYAAPGVLGFIFVVGMPYSIARIGALQTIVALIASQLVAGMLWDAAVEGTPVNLVRVAGAVLAFLGAALVSFKG